MNAGYTARGIGGIIRYMRDWTTGEKVAGKVKTAFGDAVASVVRFFAFVIRRCYTDAF